MLLLWDEGTAYWAVGLGYALIGAGRRVRRHPGIALAHRLGAGDAAPGWRRGRRTSNAISAARSCSRSSARCSPPGTRRRSARRSPPRRTRRRSATASQAQLQKSFAGAEAIAEQYPQYADQITAGATSSFLDGADWAYGAGIVAILLGAAIVFFFFPRAAREKDLLAQFHREDTADGTAVGPGSR